MKQAESARRKQARALLLRYGYAVGGHVKQAIAKAVHAHERHDHKGRRLTKLKRGGGAEGEGAIARPDKPRRAAGGRAAARKAGTKIIILNSHAQPAPATAPRPVTVPAPARAALVTAPRPVLFPPAAAGPATPRAAARQGGRIKRAPGAAPRLTAGAKNALGRLQKMRAYGQR
jgi:hypothetical protein